MIINNFCLYAKQFPELANRFFDTKKRGVIIEQADAREWLSRYRGARFDIIIDDLFSDTDGIPQRAVTADESWFSLLTKNLSSTGLLIMNFADRQEYRQSAFYDNAKVNSHFESAYQFSSKLLDNRVVCFSPSQLVAQNLKQGLADKVSYSDRKRLSFNMRRLK